MTEPAGKASAERARPPRPCPICKKMSQAAAYPFCSRHCADIDLSRWLKEGYTIPVSDAPRTPGDASGEDDWEADL